PTYPAATDPVIAVAATDQQDRRAGYSNYGDWIDIAAPGTGIWSTYWAGASTYRADTGTSMAAPHVSGVIALMLSLRPALTPSDVETILRATADPVTDSGLGAGRLNAARAVAAVAARAGASPAASAGDPTATPAPTGSAVPTPISAAAGARSRAFSYNVPSPATTVYLPGLLRTADGWNTRVTFMNTTPAPTSLAIRLVDGAGAASASLSTPLAPFGSTTFDLAAA